MSDLDLGEEVAVWGDVVAKKVRQKKGTFSSKDPNWVHSLDGLDKLMSYQNSTFRVLSIQQKFGKCPSAQWNGTFRLHSPDPATARLVIGTLRYEDGELRRRRAWMRKTRSSPVVHAKNKILKSQQFDDDKFILLCDETLKKPKFPYDFFKIFTWNNDIKIQEYRNNTLNSSSATSMLLMSISIPPN